MSGPSTARQTRKWWPRFGLRTLFVLVTVLGVGLGYLGIVQQRVLQQRRVVKAIEEIGGKVRYDYEIPPWEKRDDSLDWLVTISGDMTKDGRRMMTRTDQGMKTDFIETPPGPWIVRRLLGDDAFAHVYRADLKWKPDAKARTDFDPELLAELPRLEVLWLVHGQVNDRWLEAVGRIPRLRHLSLSGYEEGSATGGGLRHLQAAQHLKTLTLAGEWVHDSTLDSIAVLRGLNTLQLFQVANVTGEVFANVGELRELSRLDIIRAKRVDDRGSEHLGKLKKLRWIWLHETSITDTTVRHLASLPELELIDLTVSGAGDEGMEAISGLPKLKVLQLTKTNVGDTGAQSLSRLKGLRYLALDATKVTDAGLAAIGRMTELEHLRLWPLEVSDEGIRQLKGLTKLKELSIGPHISKAAADELREVLPQCKIRRVNAQGGSSWPDREDDPVEKLDDDSGM